jgi:hypothetical protein
MHDTQSHLEVAEGRERADRNALAGIVVLSVIVFTVAMRLRLAWYPLGDEPHYLALAQAIVKYHTFDPTQVYANRDYWSYYPAEIDAHVAVVDGRPVPFHNIGGPLLPPLPFLLWGKAGAHLVTLLASVLTVVNVYRLQRELGIRTACAGVVTVAFVIGSPLYVYASMLFVEPIGMLLVSFAVRVILSDRAGPGRLMLASAGVGYLPWVHGRYAIFPVTLGALLAVRLAERVGRRSPWPYIQGLLPMSLLALGLELFNLVEYHSLSPAPGTTDALGEGLLQLAPHRGLLSLAFDGRFGMLSHFPVLGLAFAGVLLSATRDRWKVHLVLLGTVVPYTVAVATYPNWPDGYSPPGRLLAITTPLLAYYVAVVVQHVDRWWILAGVELATAYGFTMSLLSDIYPGERFNKLAAPGNPTLDRMTWLTGTSVDRLPPVVGADNQIDDAAWSRFMAWGLAAALGTVLVWWRGQRQPVARTVPADSPKEDAHPQ